MTNALHKIQNEIEETEQALTTSLSVGDEIRLRERLLVCRRHRSLLLKEPTSPLTPSLNISRLFYFQSHRYILTKATISSNGMSFTGRRK
jgi:hypothetical protein